MASDNKEEKPLKVEVELEKVGATLHLRHSIGSGKYGDIEYSVDYCIPSGNLYFTVLNVAYRIHLTGLIKTVVEAVIENETRLKHERKES